MLSPTAMLKNCLSAVSAPRQCVTAWGGRAGDGGLDPRMPADDGPTSGRGGSPFARVVVHATEGHALSHHLALSATFSRALRPADATPAAFVDAEPAHACEPVAGVERGSCVVIQRGGCSFEDKAMNAQAAGAHSALVVNHVDELVRMDTSASDLLVDIFVALVANSTGARLALARQSSALAVSFSAADPEDETDDDLFGPPDEPPPLHDGHVRPGALLALASIVLACVSVLPLCTRRLRSGVPPAVGSPPTHHLPPWRAAAAAAAEHGARALVCACFVEDGLRVLLQWRRQMEWMLVLPLFRTAARRRAFGRVALVLSAGVQLVGAACVLARVRVRAACAALGCWLSVQPLLYGQALNARLLCSSAAVGGALYAIVQRAPHRAAGPSPWPADAHSLRPIGGAGAGGGTMGARQSSPAKGGARARARANRLLQSALYLYEGAVLPALHGARRAATARDAGHGLAVLALEAGLALCALLAGCVLVAQLVLGAASGSGARAPALQLSAMVLAYAAFAHPFWATADAFEADAHRFAFFHALSSAGGLLLIALAHDDSEGGSAVVPTRDGDAVGGAELPLRERPPGLLGEAGLPGRSGMEVIRERRGMGFPAHSP